MLTSTTGEPVTISYAQVLADLVGYEAGSVSGAEAYWRGPRVAGGPYSPGIYADVNRIRYYTAEATFTLFLVSAERDGVTCRMLGERIPDDDLFAIIAAWAHLPYARQVSQALIDQADWLDAHPMYRGLPVKHRPHLSPDAVEVAP